jgi:hypothetical protein
VFDPDASIGVSTCDWFSELAGNEDAADTTVGTTVNAYYTRDDSGDDVVVTVAKPLDDFITGGGYIVTTDSGGVYANDVGAHANYGFHVKFNKKGTNLQGRATLIVRSGDRVYQIKSNSLDSLGVHVADDKPGEAEFEAKANLIDVTDPYNPVSVSGNLVLQMRMTDLSEDDGADLIGWSLWDVRRGRGNQPATQLLLHSSNWTGNETQQQIIAAGNLMVH